MREKQAKKFFQVPSHAVSRILFFNRCSSVPKPKAGMENERINQFMPAPANEAACRHGSGAGGGITSPRFVSPLGCRSLQHILANHTTGR